MTTFEQTPAKGADTIGPMRKGSNGIRRSMDIVFAFTLQNGKKSDLRATFQACPTETSRDGDILTHKCA